MQRRYIQAKLMLIQTVMPRFFVEFATANSFMNVKNKTTSHSLYLLYIQGWIVANLLIFSLLDIKLCFSSLLVRNAKLVSFFFVRNYYLSTKTKIQCRDKTLYFSYTYIGFSAVFALVFLVFLVRFNDFYTKKSPNHMSKLLYLSHILDFSKIFS